MEVARTLKVKYIEYVEKRSRKTKQNIKSDRENTKYGRKKLRKFEETKFRNTSLLNP